MKKHLVPLIAGFAAILLAAGSASAQVIANFSQGVGTEYASTQFVGKAGDGWNNPWATSSANTTLTTSVTNVNPMFGTDNYLKVEIDAATTVSRSGLNRQFNDALAQAPHTLTFSIRFDTLNNWGTGDFIGIFATNNAQTATSTSGQTWGILISGSSGAISFRAAESGTGQTVNTGITVATGITYTFVLNVNPDTVTPTAGTWQATLTTSDSQAFSSGTMGFRVDATVGRTFNLNTLGNSSGDDWSYSFSGLSVIPEPSSMALLLGSVLFGAVALRRKSRP